MQTLTPSVENQTDVTFLRGKGFPYEGKLSAVRLTDEVDSVS